MKLYTKDATSSSSAAILAVAELTGQKVEVQTVTEETKEIKNMNVLGKFPILHTEAGNLQEPTAIISYLASVAGKHNGSNEFEKSQVDQWLSFINSSLGLHVHTILMGILGTGEVTQAAWNESAK